ncbi:sugar transferase [Flavobacterium tistrianum]|uniref:sugar transferase n=1 Tax=Flavobacterium tistrianum TaxID=1685414 RepID=UPI000DAE241D|nr:sugar transferase [Flavobacterium tistrianum]KAF2342039.1 sugar transferase [Flavobacterium tistrianum]
MYKILKPFIDFIGALSLLICTLPIILILIFCLTIANNGKPFFRQRRPGKNGKIFKITKFKTMNDKVDLEGVLLSDGERLTKVGSFIRKTSLDELPQLLNVLMGDMSLIGPRPLLPEYLPLYNDFQKQRHNVRPGITGWAQVNGRNAISWQEKFKFDVYYAKNVSFLLDLKIVFLTIEKVFRSEGINANNAATTESFKGN